ncbi:putative holin [Burkholderia cenocepacia]|uniref:putative holin n=1 Tax=Burkholderia cenocepacia TaxID=95486 RepID=UPI000F5B3C9E|nr:putative holin [Burkholderia cenocepacia]RQU52937.1 hypothetical protein DF143_32715 [Burkholderia cenocepacia]RQV35059.1 hypothetical protein DF033_32045 [Burkholderia cenocepacia]
MTQFEKLWLIVGAAGARAWTHWDLTLVSGVMCGALVFLLRSHEPSWPRKTGYFGVSLIGGYSVTPSVVAHVDWLPEWPAAFLSAAAVVTLAIVLLDWAEKVMPGLLTQLAQRVFGITRADDMSQNDHDSGHQ